MARKMTIKEISAQGHWTERVARYVNELEKHLGVKLQQTGLKDEQFSHGVWFITEINGTTCRLYFTLTRHGRFEGNLTAGEGAITDKRQIIEGNGYDSPHFAAEILKSSAAGVAARVAADRDGAAAANMCAALSKRIEARGYAAIGNAAEYRPGHYFGRVHLQVKDLTPEQAVAVAEAISKIIG